MKKIIIYFYIWNIFSSNIIKKYPNEKEIFLYEYGNLEFGDQKM